MSIIGKFIINNKIIDSVYNHYSIFNSNIFIFICNNGFCITQNLSEKINLNIFISQDHFKYYNIKFKHIIFNIDVISLKTLDNFILVFDNKNIMLKSSHGENIITNIINDIDMYNFCTNINNSKCICDMFINKYYF